jgi:hypothetical protein
MGSGGWWWEREAGRNLLGLRGEVLAPERNRATWVARGDWRRKALQGRGLRRKLRGGMPWRKCRKVARNSPDL